MRFRFERQPMLGTTPLSDVIFNYSSRHELVPILVALQYIYLHCESLVDDILDLIQEDIGNAVNIRKGCKGMTYWEILVLASVRLGSEMDFDQLADLASNHKTLRQMMMLSDWDDKTYSRSAIHENLQKLKAETLLKINDLIVGDGHKLSKAPLKRVRGDSFVMQKNIHHPTDSNLILDGCRRVIELSSRLADFYTIPGWRKHAYLYKQLKTDYRKLTKISKSKSKDRDERLKARYFILMEKVKTVIVKSLSTLSVVEEKRQANEILLLPKWQGCISDIQYYIAGVDYVMELANRRVFLEEKIPNSDKVYSLFEPDTELINRGKHPNPIEFGHRVLVIQDNAGFILHHEVMDIGMTDEKIITSCMKKLQEKYQGKIEAASFDKGFWSPDNLKELSKVIKHVVLPKKGNHTEADKQRESDDAFGKIRKWHSGIESAIGALQSGNAVKVCRDKGTSGFKRYLSMAVLGRNIHNLGKILIDKERKKQRKHDPLDALIAAA